MRLTFIQFCESIESSMDDENMRPLMKDDGSTKSSLVYLKQDTEFWEKLGNLANSDPEGIGELLGVDSNQVSTWYGKIKQVADEAKRVKQEKDEDQSLSTGVEA